MSDEDLSIEKEFEYNDGLGDLLKEKERQEFSWVKTLVVLVSIITVVSLSFMVVFRVGRSLMVKAPQTTFKAPVQVNAEPVPSNAPAVAVPVASTPITQPVKNSDILGVGSEGARPVQSSSVSVPKSSVKRSVELHRVVVGSFKNLDRAHGMVKDLKKRGIDSYVWIYRSNGATYYRVQIAAFKNASAARRLSEQMQSKYKLDAVIIKQ